MKCEMLKISRGWKRPPLFLAIPCLLLKWRHCPATRRSSSSSPPRSGSRRGPRFPLSGRGDCVLRESLHGVFEPIPDWSLGHGGGLQTEKPSTSSCICRISPLLRSALRDTHTHARECTHTLCCCCGVCVWYSSSHNLLEAWCSMTMALTLTQWLCGLQTHQAPADQLTTHTHRGGVTPHRC